MKNGFLLCAAGLLCAYGFYQGFLHQSFDANTLLVIEARPTELNNRTAQAKQFTSSAGFDEVTSREHSVSSITGLNYRDMTSSDARRLGEALARKDPVSGLREITQHKEKMGEMHFIVQQELLAHWFLLSPAAFFRNADFIRECVGEDSYNTGWIDKAIEYDFVGFQDKIKYIADSHDRKVAMDQVSSVLMQRAPQAAVSWARSLPVDDQAFALKQILVRGGAITPEQAAILATQMPADSERVELVQVIATEWANNDVTAALKWCEALSTQSEREAAFEPIFAAYVEKQPEDAANYALRLVDSANGYPYLRRAIQELAKIDIDRAWDYTQELSKLGRSDDYMTVMVDAWANLDPIEAIDVLSKASAASDAYFPKLVERIAATNPLVLANRLSEMPEGELRRAALNSSAKELWRKSPDTAREWLDSDAARPYRDDAISAIIRSFSDFAPEEMRQLSAQINDPHKRTQASQFVLNVLQRVNPEPSAAFIR